MTFGDLTVGTPFVVPRLWDGDISITIIGILWKSGDGHRVNSHRACFHFGYYLLPLCFSYGNGLERKCSVTVYSVPGWGQVGDLRFSKRCRKQGINIVSISISIGISIIVIIVIIIIIVIIMISRVPAAVCAARRGAATGTLKTSNPSNPSAKL